MITFRYILLSLLVLCTNNGVLKCGEVTLVYNLRIAEVTKRQTMEEGRLSPSIAVVTFVDQQRETHNGIHESVNAGLATLAYSPHDWYIRADAAVGHVHAVGQALPSTLKTSRTQVDDLLFTGGNRFTLSDRTKITLSAMFGIPTHKDVGLLGVEFGTGHFGVGAQVDAACAYSNSMQHMLMGAARYVYFIPRTAPVCINHQQVPFNLKLGNVVDLLVANYSSWGRHKFEVGYDATFAFDAHLIPSLAAIPDSSLGFIRSSVYVSYRLIFPVASHGSGITVGLSCSTDHWPRTIGFRYITTVWAGWGINF